MWDKPTVLDAGSIYTAFGRTDRESPSVAFCPSAGALHHFIEPGKPVQNAKVESFHGRLREECLNASWFQNLWDARGKISAWRREYNQVRPHSSLGYRTPEEFAKEAAVNGCGKAAPWKPLGSGVPTPLGNPAKTAGFPLSHNLGGGSIATDQEKDAAEVV